MEPITRRQFLGTAGVALAGAAAGSRLRSAVRGPSSGGAQQCRQRGSRPVGLLGRSTQVHAAPCHTQRARG